MNCRVGPNNGSQPTPAPQDDKPLCEHDVILLKIPEGVPSQSYCMYCPDQVKALIDDLSETGTTTFVEFHHGKSPDYFYMIASTQGTKGAVPVKESRTGGTATVNVSVPMRVAGVGRPADGRKARLQIEWDANSPYGRAIGVYTKPLGNEPIKAHKKKAPAATPGQPSAPTAPQAEAGDGKANT